MTCNREYTMTEPARRPRVPWLILLTLVGLAAVQLLVFRNLPGKEPLSWQAAWAAALAGMAVFLVLCWQHAYMWSLIAGILLPPHLLPELPPSPEAAFLAEALVL